MKHPSLLFAFLAMLSFGASVVLMPTEAIPDQESEQAENPQARAEQEWMMLRDPATGEIPRGIFGREQEFARTLPARREFVLGKTGSTRNAAALTWIERGPTNVGGRTRAFGIDLRTTSAPNITMIAGGVSGGLWRSTNDGTSWTQVSTAGQLHSVSCLVQDVRAGKEDTWYAGSGESFGNSAGGGGGASFRGDGVFKSTDNGLTWAQLPSTSTGTPQSFDQPFDYVTNVATDPSNAGQDELYAAASNVVLRSTDGGTSWTTILGTFSTSVWSDVQVTAGGVVYAALPSTSTSPGIWRSPDGVTWTSISSGVAGFPTAYSRIVIAVAPSNPATVYFLMQGTNGTNGVNQVNSHQLWQYTYVSGTGAGAGGTWVNRGANLPSLAFPNEPFDSQGGYDLLVKTSPTDANFVLIGGTNLYRSTDGFATTGNTARIGGYDPNITNGVYPSHHPDQHAGAFRPGSSLVYYSANDGGLARTSDITTNLGGNNPVSWTSLNNGYNVTQFYGVSLAPESGSNFMLGGTQDNGNRIGSSAGASAWGISPEGGDGTFTAVAPLADDRYFSETQLGSLRSRQRNTSFIQTFTPSGSTNQLFVNPYLLDPNSSSLLYYAAGNSAPVSGVWRNSSAVSSTPSLGWTYLTSTSITSAVSAIGVSTANPANVLYYGSSTGQMRRVVGANTGTAPTVTDITAGLPTGYINCIAVDPADANIILAVFTNYNIQSLWYSTNGGTSWTDVEGNLAGASGPSLRWAKIFSVSGVPHYFVAASTGVYFTILLNGASTVWTQEATGAVGNIVCTMLDWRANDGTLALATHGRGIFTTTIASPLPVQLTSFTATLAPGGRGVRLEWVTASEINNYGFYIERRSNGEAAFVEIPGAFIAGQGTTVEPHEYAYTDFPSSAGTWHYRLRQVDAGGGAHYSDEVTAGIVSGVTAAELPRTTGLLQNYPNPFNPTTTFRYRVADAVRVQIVIFDVAGRQVATLIDERQEPGEYTLPWNARGFASGMYIARLSAGGVVEAKKVVLAR